MNNEFLGNKRESPYIFNYFNIYQRKNENENENKEFNEIDNIIEEYKFTQAVILNPDNIKKYFNYYSQSNKNLITTISTLTKNEIEEQLNDYIEFLKHFKEYVSNTNFIKIEKCDNENDYMQIKLAEIELIDKKEQLDIINYAYVRKKGKGSDNIKIEKIED